MMTVGNVTTVNAIGYNSPMPDSRAKPSRWINVALVVAFLLAPVVWHVVPTINTDDDFEELTEDELAELVKALKKRINPRSPRLIIVRPTGPSLDPNCYWQPPPLFLMFVDLREYHRRCFNFAAYVKYSESTSPSVRYRPIPPP